jgi:hypothetical protein
LFLEEREMGKKIVLGGILLGDTFRLNDWITRQGDDLEAYSDRYNRDAIEILRIDSDPPVPIITNVCLGAFQREAFSWVDFENFLKMLGGIYPDEEFILPKLDDLHHSLTRIPYRMPQFALPLPERYICVQPQTHFGFKDIQSLYQVRFPLPVVNIGGRKDTNPIRGAQIENGRQLREVAYIIKNAALMLGVDSWATQFAAQIGTPSIKCHFGSWEFNHRSVRELEGGVDLYKPKAAEIEHEIHCIMSSESTIHQTRIETLEAR